MNGGWTEHLNMYANGEMVTSERCRHISKMIRKNKGKKVMNINILTVGKGRISVLFSL